MRAALAILCIALMLSGCVGGRRGADPPVGDADAQQTEEVQKMDDVKQESARPDRPWRDRVRPAERERPNTQWRAAEDAPTKPAAITVPGPEPAAPVTEPTAPDITALPELPTASASEPMMDSDLADLEADFADLDSMMDDFASFDMGGDVAF